MICHHQEIGRCPRGVPVTTRRKVSFLNRNMIVKKFCAPVLLIAATAIAACQPLSPQDRSNLGLLGGAGAGLLLAEAFDANPAWTVVATLAGAGVGTQVARNTQTGQCAYSNGDGTYSVGAC